MIRINSGITNSIVLRFNDIKTITNPIYLFELTSVQSNQVYLFTATDISTNTRYNEFLVWEITGTTHSLAYTASTPRIELEYGGVYNYKVIQKAEYSLTYSTLDMILDYGKALFYNGEYQDFFFEIGDDDTYEIFDESSAFSFFEEEDLNSVEIFDPEFGLDTALMTEMYEDIETEDGDILIY